jgi:hypothetical protein
MPKSPRSDKRLADVIGTAITPAEGERVNCLC